MATLTFRNREGELVDVPTVAATRFKNEFGSIFEQAALGSPGVAVAWGMARLGRWLPARSHPARHPALTWSVALPIWIALATMSLWFAPAAAYLWIVPLFSAGVLLSITPPGNDPLVRVASVVVLCVCPERRA